MNKKLLIALIIVAVLIYYLNEERPSKSLMTSKSWIIPQTLAKISTKLNSPKETKTAITVNAPEVKKELTINFPNTEHETDYSWLTDDNLEFILKHWTPIQTALTKQNSQQKKFHLRTDLANIYNCFYKAKTNQDWDLPEFLERLEDNKAQYTLFPLRVNDNHWGLFVLEEVANKPTPPMPGSMWLEPATMVETKVYYTSSGGGELETEKQQLEPFIAQIVGENTPIETIHPQDRKSKGYECGVYLCFYVREILTTGKLELNQQYSSEECQEFRRDWKAKIGESWGKW